MAARTTRLLNGLSLLLVLAAVLLPLWLTGPDLLLARQDLRWTTTQHFFPPRQSSEEIRDHYGFGFTVYLANEGDAPTGEVRVVLDYVPEHVDLLALDLEGVTMGPAPGRYSEEGYEVRLPSLAPGQRVGLPVYRAPFDVVSVYEDGERVWGDEQTPVDFTPRAWLPDWTIYGGALLIAGLVLRILALQRRLAEEERRYWARVVEEASPGAT